MKKTEVNFALDLLLLLLLTCLISTGLVLEFLLPPGSGRVDTVFEGHRGPARPIDLLWGLGRHQWGDIHFWTAVSLLGVVSIHLILHWRWIVSMIVSTTRGVGENRHNLKPVFVSVTMFVVVLILLIPWLGPRRTVRRGDLIEDEPLAWNRRSQPESLIHSIDEEAQR